MSFINKKHLMLVLAVLMLLIIVPTSFASDVNDDGYVATSADDAVIASDVDSVNTTVSASVDADDDVIGANEDLITTPNPSTVDDYTPGDSKSITVSFTKSSNFEYYFQSETLYMQVMLNDEYTKGTYYSVSSLSSGSFDLKNFNSSCWKSGENTIIFYVNQDRLDYWDLSHQYNPLTVTVGGSEPVDESQIYVDGSVDTTGTGTKDSPFKTIGEAITKANTLNESTIHIAAGIYEENSLIINKTTTIVGSNRDDVIIDAQKQGRIFDIAGDNVVVSIMNMTLQNGSADEKNNYNTAQGVGGAIRASYGAAAPFHVTTLNLNNITFRNNYANTVGGAVYIGYGQTASFSSNSPNYLNVVDCEFYESSAASGGSAIETLANTNIQSSLFDSNSLSGSSAGGTVRSNSQRMTLDIYNSTFIRNTANRGAAIYFSSMNYGSAKVNYCVFVNNTGTNAGYGKVIGAGSNRAFDLNNNWFGTNSPDFTEILPYYNDAHRYLTVPNVYAQLNLTANPNEITTGGLSSISSSFIWNDNTTDNVDKLPARSIALTTNGTLTETEGNVGLSSEFSSSEAGSYIVYATVDNQKSNVTITVSAAPAPSFDYVTTPSPNSSDYVIGDDLEISVAADYDEYTDMSDYGAHINVYVDGNEETAVFTTGVDAGERSFTVNLKDFADKLSVGVHNITFHPTINFLEDNSLYDCLFNKLTVNVTAAPVPTYEYVTTPSPNSTDYVKGSDLNVDVTAVFGEYADNISGYGYYMNVYLDGNEENPINVTSFDAGVTSFTFNLKDISDDLSVGVHNITFHPRISILENLGNMETYLFNKLTVNVTEAPAPADAWYVSTPTKESIVYFKGQDTIIDVNVDYEIPYLSYLNDLPMRVFIAEYHNDWAINGVDANATSFSFNFNDLEDIGLSVDNYTVYFAPQLSILEYAMESNNYTLNNITVVVKDFTDEIFVSVNGSDADGDGSEEAPYATITKALAEVTDARNKIIVLEGSYNTNTTYSITQSVSITARGNVSLTKNNTKRNNGRLFDISANGVEFNLTGITIENVSANNVNGYIIYASTDSSDASDEIAVNIENCTIRNNSMTVSNPARMIHANHANLTIIHSNILDNNAGTNLIYIGQAALVMNYNNILNITSVGKLISGLNPKGNINYNFWGTQTKPDVGNSANIPEFTNWVVVDASIDNETIYKDNDYNLNFTFKSTTDGTTLTDLDDVMPSISFDLSSDLDNAFGNSTIEMVDNEATTTYGTTNAGSEEIDVNYADVVANLTFEVVNPTIIPTNLNVEPVSLELTVGENDTIATTVLPDSLKPTFTSDNESVATVDENGTVVAVGEGNAIITVSVGDDVTYAINTTTVAVTVSPNVIPKSNLTISASADHITEGENATIVVSGLEDATGNVTAKVGDGVYTAPIEDGVATITVSGLTENATAEISYAGDDKYNNASTTVDIVVNPKVVPKENATMDVVAPSVTEGENATVTVTLPSDATGNVTVGDVTVPVENGTATVTIAGLPAGNTTLPVVYSGDDKYNANETTVTITVDEKPAPVKENLTISASADAITEGEDATIVVSGLKDATGNVTAKVGDGVYTAPIENGVATIVVPGLTENATAEISYAGDDKYNNASTTADIVVNPKVVPKENATMSVDAPGITEGENATVTVTLPSDATGNVTVGNTTVPVKDGKAVVSIADLPVGNNTIPVVYSGDDKYNTNETTVTVSVDEKPAPVKENATMDVVAPSVTEGENATVTVTLPSDATGNVTVGDVTVPVENGTATVTIADLPAGNTTLPVIYSGDDKYNANETTVTVTVDEKPAPVKENLTIEASADAITVGEDAVIVVSGLANATGNVTAKVGDGVYTAPIENGVATITISGLTENATAEISYAGDDKYNNASTTADIVVNPKVTPKENATMNVTAPEVTEGENATITVTLPEDATGNVTATVGNKTYTAPVENGTATLSIPELSAGNYTIPVAYSGDEKYSPNETTVDVTVDEDKSDIVSAPDVEKYFAGSERFVVNVTDSEGNPIANKSVAITINGVTYNRKTNANGTTSIPLGLPAGVYNVTTVVDNQTINSVATIKTTVNGTDIIKVFRNGTQYYATFRDSEGNYLSEGSEVEFNINGVFYTRTVKENGLAKLNINLEQGEYIITAINKNTGEKSSNNITVISRIIENNDLTKYFRNASQYTVKVIGDDGKAVGAGVEVTFNINGVFYTRTTNASGIAKLNINLEAGDYIITAEYAGCKVSNNIKVLPILNATDLTKKFGTRDQFVAKLVDGQGNPYAGQTVQFNINGVFYNRVTGSDGNARLNINLQPGEYIITSSYGGFNIANTVKVNA